MSEKTLVNQNQKSDEKEEQKPKKLLIVSDTRRLDCGVCKSIMHNPTSTYPCFHSFCMGCISRWFGETISCPVCRAPTCDLVSNRELTEFIETYLEQNPEEARSQKEKEQLDEFEMLHLAKQVQTPPSMSKFIDRFSFDPRFGYGKLERYKYEKDMSTAQRVLKLATERLEKLKTITDTDTLNDQVICVNYQKSARVAIKDIQKYLNIGGEEVMRVVHPAPIPRFDVAPRMGERAPQPTPRQARTALTRGGGPVASSRRRLQAQGSTRTRAARTNNSTGPPIAPRRGRQPTQTSARTRPRESPGSILLDAVLPDGIEELRRSVRLRQATNPSQQ